MDSRTELKDIVISVVHLRTIKPTAFVRLAVRCLVALLCASTLGTARGGAGRPDNRPVDLGVVRQAHVEPRTITLPVVDGKDIRFTRLSTDEGLSQTRVIQIVQDAHGRPTNSRAECQPSDTCHLKHSIDTTESLAIDFPLCPSE